MASCREIISTILNNADVIQAVDKALNANTTNTTMQDTTVSDASHSAPQEAHVENEVRRMFRGRAVPCHPPRYMAQQNIGQFATRSSSRILAKRNRQFGICGPSTFTKDIVLLPDPMVDAVPRRGNKQWLYSNGHVKNAVEIFKNWDSTQVINNLRMVFKDKLEQETQIEILMGLHNKLVKPNLAGDQTLSGIMIHKVFTSKTIYLRPSKMILECTLAVAEQQSNMLDSDHEYSESTVNKQILGEELGFQGNAELGRQPLREQKEVEATACDNWLSHSANVFEVHSLPADTLSETILSDIENGQQQIADLFSNTYSSFETSEAGPSNFNTSHIDACHVENINVQTPLPSHSSQNDPIDPYHHYINLLEKTPVEDIDNAKGHEDVLNLDLTEESMLLEDILRNIAKDINEDDISIFNINRLNIWEGALHAFKRSSYCPFKKMSVKFTDDVGQSEGAVDLGGPRREFLQLLMRSIKQSYLFTGPENEKIIALNSGAMRNDEYFIAGRAIAVCLVHGGPPPQFFSKEMFEALRTGPENVKFEWSVIPDEDIRQQLESIVQAQDLYAAQEAVQKAEHFLDLAGCIRAVTTMEIAKQIADDAANWYFIGRTRCALERLKYGLSTFNILDLISKFPESFRGALCKCEILLRWQHIDSIFVIQLTSPGSNKRAVQERIIGWWRDYLVDVQDGESKIMLGQLLSFGTGTDYPPALGWDIQPSITFQFTSNIYPRSNTCSNILYLPTIHNNYEDFKKQMDFAIQNSPGFGQP